MKTIKEWLEELPEPYRTQAIENCNASLKKDDQSFVLPSLSTALSGAFSWYRTPQGWDYWRKLYETL